jgi:hypothetical protein
MNQWTQLMLTRRDTHTPALLAEKLPDTGELEVRKTILLTLYRRSIVEISDMKSWKGFD